MLRRTFVPTLAAPLLARREEATLILYNANIVTVDRAQPRAQAMAIAGDRFVAVGGNDDVLALAGAGTRKVNLEGRTVTPGFIDAHSHPASSGRRHLAKEVDCDLRSVQAIVDAIRKRAAQAPERPVGPGFQIRRHQDGRRPRPHPAGSRSGRARPSRLHQSPRRPHGIRELQRLARSRCSKYPLPTPRAAISTGMPLPRD